MAAKPVIGVRATDHRRVKMATVTGLSPGNSTASGPQHVVL